MRRRTLIAGMSAAAILTPFVARAQQKATPVIGILDSASGGPLSSPFRQALRENGYVEGQNLAIEHRWAHGRYERLPDLAAELVALKVHVIVTVGGTVSARAAKNATSTIPIVFLTGGDPVESGLVMSYARPGGNLTGYSIMATGLDAKRLELLSELVPHARVVGILVNVNNQAIPQLAETEDAARVRGIHLNVLRASSESEIHEAFSNLVEYQAGAVIISPDGFFNSQREQLLDLASRHSIPAIYWLRHFTEAGGLISYGSDLVPISHTLGTYTAQILNGAKLADLPIRRPTKFELVINIKTATALGLTVPQSLLARADEVIE